MKMAGSLHPPFSLFLPEGKEKTGRARSKREKEVSPLRGDGGRGTRRRCFLRVRMSIARGVARAGGVEVVEWTFSAFRCRSPLYSAGLYWMSNSFAMSFRLMVRILLTPFSCMVTPYSTSASSMVPRRWVMTINWVFPASPRMYRA